MGQYLSLAADVGPCKRAIRHQFNKKCVIEHSARIQLAPQLIVWPDTNFAFLAVNVPWVARIIVVVNVDNVARSTIFPGVPMGAYSLLPTLALYLFLDRVSIFQPVLLGLGTFRLLLRCRWHRLAHFVCPMRRYIFLGF